MRTDLDVNEKYELSRSESYIMKLYDDMMKQTPQKVEVMELITTGGTLADPCAEPWFRMAIYFSDSARYSIITKDGTSFRYLGISAADSPNFIHEVWGDGVPFSPENESMVKEAIRRYIREL